MIAIEAVVNQLAWYAARSGRPAATHSEAPSALIEMFFAILVICFR